MGEPAKELPPLEHHLLEQPLASEAPELEGEDDRLEQLNGLVSRSAYVDAGRAAEALLREGLYDVRLVGPYLLGLFLDGGLQALPAVFHSLSCVLLRNWQFFGPRERKDVFADSGLRWLIKLLNKHLEHHERLKDETWQRWGTADNREPLEKALALGEEIFSAFGRVMPRNGCEAPFRRLTQWLEGHLQSLPAASAGAGPGAGDAAEPGEQAGTEGEPSEPEPSAPAPSGPTVPASPALVQLMRRLEAFDALVERQDFQRASVVAADVLHVVEHFDPRVYLPALFSRFFAGLSTCAEHVEPLLQSTESLSFRALDQLYRVDLEAFLAQEASAGAGEGEEGE
jgi:hypothetical protein